MKIFFGIWFVSSLILTGLLHLWHGIDYKPKINLDTAPLVAASGKWEMVHILGAGCLCSEYLAAYLGGRKSNQALAEGISETIFVLGSMPDQERLLQDAGFAVQNKNPKQLGISLTGVPLLIIYDPDGNMQYVGGYSDKLISPASDLQDLKILHNLQSQKKTASLPAKGCTISKNYAAILDPLGLKYNKEDLYER